MKCFVDRNVLVYAKDNRAPLKQKTASKWFEALTKKNALILSGQSLREFYAASLRRDRSPTAVRDARAEIEKLYAFVPDALFIDRLDEAWAVQDRHSLNFWDSLLVVSALAAGCSIFLSEDMNAGQKIETLTIVNPFNTPPEALLGA